MNRSPFARILLASASLLASTFAFAAPELLVLNKADATLTFFEPESGMAIAIIEVGNGPHEIDLSSDGKLAIVSNYGTQTLGNTLSLIDVPARGELARIDVGELRRPHGLTFVEDSVYFTSEEAQRIARFDTKTRRVDWQFETRQIGTHMVLATPDGSKLFTSNIGSNSIGIIERGSKNAWKQTLVKVGAGPEGLDLAPNGRELWSAHSRDGGVSIIDVAKKKVIATVDVKTKRSNRLKFTPDGRLALISDLSGGELVVVDTATRSVRTRLAVGRTPTGIVVRPDGHIAYVACSGDNFIAVVDLDSLRVEKTIATGNSPDGMAWAK